MKKMPVSIKKSEDKSNEVAVFRPRIPRIYHLEWKPCFSLGLLAKALAWGHYFYEADFGLCDFKKKKDNYEAHHGVKISTNQKGILICSKTIKFQIAKRNIQQASHLESTKCAVDSTEGREYFNPVIKLKSAIYDKNGIRSYYIVETPSALETLLQIAQFCTYINISKVKEEYVLVEFTRWLYHLLSQDNKCKKWFDLTFVENDCLLEILEGNATKSPFDYKVDWAINYEGVGYSLGYFYFFNYLIRIFSDLKIRIDRFIVNHGIYGKEEKTKYTGKKKFVPVLFTIVPKSGTTRRRLDEDPSEEFIECVDSLAPHVEFIGLKYRPYTSTVYKIKHPSKQPLYCLAEFSAPVRQLDNMRKHPRCSPYLENIFDKELKNFSDCLTNLLKLYDYQSLCQVVNYNDDDGTLLSEVLYEHCQKYQNKI